MIVAVTLSLGASASHQDYVRESQCRVLRMFIAHVLCGERNEVTHVKNAPTKAAARPASTASPAAAAPSMAPASVNPPNAPAQPTQASVASVSVNAYASRRIVPPVVPPSFSGGNSSGKPTAGIGSVDHRNGTQGNPQARQNNVSGQPQQTGSASQQQGQQAQQGQAGGNGQGNDKGNQGKHTGQTK